MQNQITQHQYIFVTTNHSGTEMSYGNGKYWTTDDALVLGWWWAESEENARAVAYKELIEECQWPAELVDKLEIGVFQLANTQTQKSWIITTSDTLDSHIELSDGKVKAFGGATEVGVYRACNKGEAFDLARADFKKWGFSPSEIESIELSAYAIAEETQNGG